MGPPSVGSRMTANEARTSPQKWRSSFRELGPWFLRGSILFALSFFVATTSGFNRADESWFLQVVHRVMAGDVLYRDVFFGATPLSIYITAAFAAVFGTEILVVKAMVGLFFVLTVLLCCRIAQQLGSARSFPLLLVMGLFVYGLPQGTGAYSPLANLFFLGCFSSALSWRKREDVEDGAGNGWSTSTNALSQAGVAAGLCFVSKQNFGVYALVALLLTVVMGSRGTGLSRRGPSVAVLRVLAAFLLASALVLLPVWFSGGIEKLFDYGFANKAAYLQLARVSYLEGLKPLGQLVLSMLLDGLRHPRALLLSTIPEATYWQARFLLPFLAFPTLLVSWLSAGQGRRGVTTTVLLFVGAGFLGMFPRADSPHLTDVVPELLLGLTCAWYHLQPRIAPRWVRLTQAGLRLWFVIGLGFMLVKPSIGIASGTYQLSDLPHFRGPLVPVRELTEIRTYAKTLAEGAGGEQIFLLSPEAGFYYLATGLQNPTAFDYPLATTFGRNGQAEVIAVISRGEIRAVCLDSRWSTPLSPLLLERYVVDHMERSNDLGFCTLYRPRSLPRLGPRG